MKNQQHSINLQIIGFMVASLAVVILLVWLMNTLFLGRFYLSYKTSSMEDAFHTLNGAAEDGLLYEDSYSDQIQKLCSNENLSLMIIASDGTVIMQSQNESRAMMEQLFDLMLERQDGNAQLIKSTDVYTIQKKADDRTGDDFLTLWGTLADGNLILLRSAMQSMTDAAALSNRLLLYIGVLSLCLGVVLSIVVARHITRPVHQMTELSQRMTELDFDAKYVPRQRPNELDLLGLRMNEMSDTLEATIRDLKQANTELTRDIGIRDENERMRREFISNVSHELKTPLALIRGYAEGLSEGVFEDEESRAFYLDVIVDETEKMDRMVRQLLSLNRLEYGEGQVKLERFNLAELVASVVQAHQILLDEQQIAVAFPDAKKAVPVWADPVLSEQVVDNYLSNAIHYAAGEKRIDLRFEEKDGKIRFSVFNTGEPVREDALPHLWEKFYKADEARTREYGGSGIGLSIVRAVADGLHTDCGVVNYENGVAFWFDFDK